MQQQLSEFADRSGVPAAIAGTLTSDGVVQMDVRGVRRRGQRDKATLHDQWHIGSCAKSMTAALYARLVEQGDADWRQPVGSLFPDLVSEISSGWRDRTIESLFLCQGGMQANPKRTDMRRLYADNRPLTEQRTDIAMNALRAAPGPRGRFVYSNLSYMVIGAAIDRITGMPFETALQQQILEPLGITSLGYGPPGLICGHHARVRVGNGLFLKGKPADPQAQTSDNPRVFSSAGTMHLTMIDWTKFLGLFIARDAALLLPETIDYLLMNPNSGQSTMTMGWAKADGLGDAAFGMQGSNTLWAASALIDATRNKLSFVVCNDGRTRILAQSAHLAASLLQRDSSSVSQT